MLFDNCPRLLALVLVCKLVNICRPYRPRRCMQVIAEDKTANGSSYNAPKDSPQAFSHHDL